MKSLIIFLLPAIIFCLLFSAVVNLASRATYLVGLILLLVCCSNYTTTFLSHYIGMIVYHFDLSLMTPEQIQGMTPAWSFELPKLLPNNIAMFSGLALGLLASFVNGHGARRFALMLDKFVAIIMKLIASLIPFFVAGFIVKLQADGLIRMIVHDYTRIFLVIVAVQYTYILLAYFLLNGVRFRKTAQALNNMLPAALGGFSTMSSAASMPLTIIGVENNTENKELARSVVPATVNVHLVGDCIAIPIFAYAIMKSFGIAEPSLATYVIFTFYFMLAKFSVAAVPGGGIIVMLPILEAYLGFNSSMLSLITALYVLFDPVSTCANVLGNGAFAKLIDRANASFGRILGRERRECFNE
jgi:Na+/H+-dicarboxylate symporter